MGDGRKGRLQEAGEILQWRRTEKGLTAGGWAIKSMRREERADCKKLGRPFSTGGEKREWIAGRWGDLLANEERSCWRLEKLFSSRMRSLPGLDTRAIDELLHILSATCCC